MSLNRKRVSTTNSYMIPLYPFAIVIFIFSFFFLASLRFSLLSFCASVQCKLVVNAKLWLFFFYFLFFVSNIFRWTKFIINTYTTHTQTGAIKSTADRNNLNVNEKGVVAGEGLVLSAAISLSKWGWLERYHFLELIHWNTMKCSSANWFRIYSHPLHYTILKLY